MLPSRLLACGIVAALLSVSAPAVGAAPQHLPETRFPVLSITHAPVTLPGAAADSALPLTWELITGPATLTGNTLTLTGVPGGITLRARQSGDAAWDPLEEYVSISVTEGGAFVQAAENYSYGYALTETGLLLRAFGRSTLDGRLSPVQKKWKQIAGYTPATSPDFLSIAGIAPDNTLWLSNAGVPHDCVKFWQPLDLAPVWRQVAAGASGVWAIRMDGTLWRMTTSPALAMVQASATADWLSLSGGPGSSMALKNSGALWQLEDSGSQAPYQVPTPMPEWQSVSAGNRGPSIGVRKDGRLALLGFTTDALEDTATDWQQAATARFYFLGLKTDASLWAGRLTMSGSAFPGSVGKPLVAGMKWRSVRCFYDHSVLIRDDGTLWGVGGTSFPKVAGSPEIPLPGSTSGYPDVGTLHRLAPEYFPQQIEHQTFRETPFPVPASRPFTLAETTLTSGRPFLTSIISGPATVSGRTLTFTGNGLVTIALTSPADEVWAGFSGSLTFLAQPDGPEIAVHDGPSPQTPILTAASKSNNAGIVSRTRAIAGIPRSITLENTGTADLTVAGFAVEPGSPVTFRSDFTPVVLTPGESRTVQGIVSADTYGIHTTRLHITSNDADESDYSLPLAITVHDFPVLASTGPDLDIPAGVPVRLLAGYFTASIYWDISSLLFEWDLDSDGEYDDATGPDPLVTLTTIGESITARLRLTDEEGLVGTDQMTITAVSPSARISAAARMKTFFWTDPTDEYAEISFSDFLMVFPCEPNGLYHVEYSPDMTQWYPEREYNETDCTYESRIFSGNDGFFPFQPFRESSHEFFRAVRIN